MTLNDVFNAEGLLKQKFPEYKVRHGQVEMASLIERALSQNRSAVIEGSTGIGKGFAYLIPLIISKERAIISTSNKSLQDQLDKKDLPTLQEAFGEKLSWTVLKGKSNYFCHEHFETNKDDIKIELERSGDFPNSDLIIQDISAWAEEEETGDIEYCPIELPSKVREMITCDNATSHEKGGEAAKFCFATQARKRAFDSQIVLVNHTLLALDISLKKESEGKASILPDTQVVIIDEAHEFERSAILAFSDEISMNSLYHLLNWSIVKNAINKQQYAMLVKGLKTVLNRYLPQKGPKYYEQLKVAKFEGFEGLITGLKSLVLAVKRLRALDDKTENKIKEIIKEANNLQKRLLAISVEDNNMLRWAEAKDNYRDEPVIKLKSVPLDISEMLRYGLFEEKTVICISATLSVHNQFDYFKQQVGMPNDCLELIVESPFNFKEQALVYVSSGESGEVNKNQEIEDLLKLSEGRAFVLFTSYKDMQDAFDYVRTPYPKLIQGQSGMTRSQVLDAFKSTPNAVLFATKSFWEGVDIVGEKLSLVIIHKVPFENPRDLVFSSKCEKMDAKAGKPVSFFRLAIPDACIKLKQGVGRLIRSSSDKGVIALLDSRVMFKPYGKVVLASLPPAYTTQKLEKVKAFFERIK